VKQNKQDRRSLRTRHLVTAAMMDLLREKRYDAITVQDLLDRAGIGRSTFYTHYFDKEDVLESMVEQIFESLRTPLSHSDGGQHLVPSLELFRHVHQNYHTFLTLERGQAGGRVWDAGQTILSKTIEQALATISAERGSHALPLTAVAQYLAGAFLTLLKWWLSAEMPATPEQMDQLFQRLALPGVWAVIGEQETI
jgi:AcrR family transcriptional regulator